MVKIASKWNDNELWDDSISMDDFFEVPKTLISKIFDPEGKIINLEPKYLIYLDKLKKSGYIAYSVINSTNKLIKYSIIVLNKPENI